MTPRKKKQPPMPTRLEPPAGAVAELVAALDPREGAEAVDARRDARVGIAALILAVALLLFPFINRAFHIDDPLFIWAAQHIAVEPANPYGFTVNWYGTPMSMAAVTKNPPLASYYLAGVARVAGWSERALHLALFVPAFAVAIGTYRLARRWCRRPLLAAGAALFTPVFLVSSLTIMCDVMMLAWWVWAVHCWLRGLDERSHAWLAAAAVCIAASALTKYFGIALIPLLLIYTVTAERRVSWPLLYLLVPVVALVGYQWGTNQLYGRGLLLDAAAYVTGTKTSRALTMPRFFANLAFTGGCVATVAFFARRLWSGRTLVVALLLGAVVVAVAFPLMSSTPGVPADSAPTVTAAARWLAGVQLWVWCTAGAGLLALAVADLRRERDAASLLLFLWIGGTFVFAGFVNWTTNGRSMLPMVVPAGILIARGLERRAAGTASAHGRPGTLVPLAAAAALAVAVAWADTATANAARDGARAAVLDGRPPIGRTLWFEGHWGFQYYMEQQGAKPIDVSTAGLTPGDRVIVAASNTNLHAPTRWATVRRTLDRPASRWIATMSAATSAGFYDFGLGLLPFAIGDVPMERFTIYEIVVPQK